MEKSAQFQGSIPQLYDRHLGPVIFESNARELAHHLSKIDSGSVLETSCGTGILTNHLRRSLPGAVKLVATDLNEAMIDFARTKKELAAADIEWKQADASALPFPDGEFEAVANQFGMMFVPDKPLAIREAKRVLKPNGSFVFNVWDRVEESPFSKAAQDVVTQVFSSEPPAFFKVPFGFYDTDFWRKILTENGFKDVQIQKVKLDCVSESAESLATGLLRGTPMSVEIQDRGLSIDEIVAALTDELKQQGGDKPFRSRMQAILFTVR